jgi:FKBP-type peptidyl-prolyl cis-trans isomerase (trigger factor)
MSEKKHTYKLLKQEKNKYTFEAHAKKEDFKRIYETEFNKESAKVKIPGFRPGKAPRAEIERKLAGDLINNTINRLLPQITYEILVDEDLNPISSVKYDIKKINDDSSIDFEFSVLDTPKINVAALTKIKVQEPPVEITDEEVETVIRNIIESSIPKEELEELKKKDEKFKITDKMVAKLGYEEETTYEGLKSKVRETLENVKREQSENEYVSNVLKEAVKVVDFFLPEDMIEDEVRHREEHFNDRLKKLDLDIEAYLKTQGKTFEEIKNEWRAEIEESAAIDILTINFARQENLVPTEEELDSEIEKIEDEVTRIRYKTDSKLRDQMRTILSRNKGALKIVELSKKKKAGK